MKVLETSLPGVLIIEPRVFGDARGFFMETYQAERYAEVGVPAPFVQDNLSYSSKGVLRGLHLQHPRAQGKLVQVLAGAVFDVAVDVRRGSPSFGRWLGIELSAENRRQLWIPPGFAHGFLVTSESALFIYKNTEYYSPETELGIRWDDPSIGIQWPLDGVAPELSHKDRMAPYLSEIPPERLPGD
ncbi:MAG: dTDP-4-dehydrorhamnose 3,5-epimerase [Sphingobacteriia bacterium]|nr:dTDP-4-dehydrorhamnose 3,5-epimerase [Sphingobacteriia bacterium]NCC39933.1 dTDP-4-dehydrorhamnose 3,5-epimerase [Gammaproteobacteria bacterium]